VCRDHFKVFDIGEEEHDIILQKVHESKVSDCGATLVFIA
jgi:hypothetical protein